MAGKEMLHYSLTLLGAYEDYPFGPAVIVVKVRSKMFAIFSRRNDQEQLSVKCDPVYAELLRKQHAAVTPGYHLNKQHWNTIVLDGSVPVEEVRRMIAHSYDLVKQSLTRQERIGLLDTLS